jgi:hypothetical protein
LTVEKGDFTFTYTPDVGGNWTVVAQWYSDRGYYTSAYSQPVPMEVTEANRSTYGGIPVEYVFIVVVAIILVVVNLSVYFYFKRTKK